MALLIDPARLEETFTIPGGPPPLAAKGRTGQAVAGPGAHPTGSGWDSSLHPRGAHGHFAAKGDGYGAQGPAAGTSQLQQRLNQLGYKTKADGKFGVNTEAAVKAFQAKYGLQQTGKVDAATLTLMREPPPQTLKQVQAQKATQKAAAKAARKKTSTTSRSRSTRSTSTGSRSTGSRLRSTGGATRPRTRTLTARQARIARGPGGMGNQNLKNGTGMGKATSPQVSALQTLLGLLGYDVGVDGRFGPQTEAAVKLLQQQHGLNPTGVVDARTKALIMQLQRQLKKSQSKGPNSMAAIVASVHDERKPDLEEQILSDGWGVQPSRAIIDFRPQGEPLNDQAIWDQRTGAQAQDVRPSDAQAPSVEPPYGELDTDEDRDSQRPPGYRQTNLTEATPGVHICASCTRFDGSNTCLGWNWLVNRTGVCDAYDSLAERLGVRLQEAVEARQAATTPGEFTTARARELLLRKRLEEMFGYNHFHGEGAWSEALHPRARGGKFADVLGKLQDMPGGTTHTFGEHSVTKHDSSAFTIRSGGRTVRADAASKVAQHLTSGLTTSHVLGATLPQDHAAVFDLSASHQHQIVPITSLVSGHEPSAERVAGSAAHMRSAATGLSAKRAPLTVEPHPSGGYRVVDGNATLQAARDAGWTHIPVTTLVHTTDGRKVSQDAARREQTDYTKGHGKPSPYLPDHVKPYTAAEDPYTAKVERAGAGGKPTREPKPQTRWAQKNALINPAQAGKAAMGRRERRRYERLPKAGPNVGRGS